MKKLFPIIFTLSLLLILSLTGCTTPEKEAKRTYAHAEELYAAKDYLGAAALYDDLARLSTPYEDSYEKENLCYMHLGDAEREAGNFATALAYYEDIAYNWKWGEVDRKTLINTCRLDLYKKEIPAILETEFRRNISWGLSDFECTSIEFIDLQRIELTFYSDAFESRSNHDKLEAMWAVRSCINSSVPNEYGVFTASTCVQTLKHTYTAELLKAGEDILMRDGEEIHREWSKEYEPILRK